VTVSPDAAWVGTFGMRVDLGCDPSTPLELGPPAASIEGLYEECAIFASGIAVGPGGAVLRAGESIALGNGFQVPAGASFEAELDAAGGAGFAYTRTLSPLDEATYHAHFYLRVDDLVMADGDRIEHLDGFDGSGEKLFRLIVRKAAAGSGKVLDLAARHDDGGESTTAAGAAVALQSGWNEIEIYWVSGSGDGSFTVSVNRAPPAGLTALSNSGARLEEVRWGAIDGILVGASGFFELDDYSSWR
jgi:hypothetical protein